MTKQQIVELILVEFPQWRSRLDKLLVLRRTHPQDDIGDQVIGIWRSYGCIGVPTISQASARKIWDTIPNSGRDSRPICSAEHGITLGAFITRAFALSNGK